MPANDNLNVFGSGSYGGGFYNKIKIFGEGTIISDSRCEVFKAFGTCDVLKNMSADMFHVMGETRIQGNLSTGKVKILGTAEVGGGATIKEMRIWGSLDIAGNLSGEFADIKGSLAVNGDAEFENFYSTGAFEIKGLLNAGEMKINPRFGKSRATEMGGEKITVKRRFGLFPSLKSAGTLEARLIEGDEIYLEYTKAEVVRGNRVTIGPGCEIGLVEYRGEFTVDSPINVKQHRKIG